MSDKTRRSYDRVAARYAADIGDELAGKPLDRAVLNAFVEPVSGLVLDLGASPGHVATYRAAHGVTVVSADLITRDVRLGSAGRVAGCRRRPDGTAVRWALPAGLCASAR